MPFARVLSVEDDQNLSSVMSHYLEEEGYQLTSVNEGRHIVDMLDKDQFDIILLDLGLPDVDGLTLIPQLRQKFNGPILVISGKTGTTDRVVGLEMGADDYITKPFEMRELVARIKANMRRNGHNDDKSVTNGHNGAQTYTKGVSESGVYIFNGWQYDSARYDLKTPEGKSISVTSGECELLSIFLESQGRALSREYLFEVTRAGNFDSFDRSIDIQVTRLRKKLLDDPQNPQLIKTVRGVGYMFIGSVEKR